MNLSEGSNHYLMIASTERPFKMQKLKSTTESPVPCSTSSPAEEACSARVLVFAGPRRKQTDDGDASVQSTRFSEPPQMERVSSSRAAL